MIKLNLGSGGHRLAGWANLDISNTAEIRCDLRGPLPYNTETVSYIFSEHFIEHLDEVDGFKLFKECYRVLVPGGKLRISCPDLEQYVKAYLNWKNEARADSKMFNSGTNYLNYAILGEALNGIKYLSPITTSCDHGHKYYYDFDELSTKLQKVGFKDVERCQWKVSTTPQLANLEYRQPLRDLIVEATK
ncbi:methyltransferase domain-containing protein [Candidatus Parcubacteria bacterium]|nr:MAG: methyltransferase domain-containing protein [Candidatus Parcubacteria bacterium]